MDLTQRHIEGVLFDKDGTLYDFGATWNAWADDILHDLSKSDDLLRARLASSIDYDLAEKQFRPHSIAIAGTNREAAQALAEVLTDQSLATLEAYLSQAAAHAPLAEAVPLAPILSEISARGISMGVVTNDSESVAKTHLRTSGVLAVFDFVAGFDSGFGSKPSPGPLLGAAEAMGLAANNMVMVGDSRHDLTAGRVAGMATVGVLTGPATADELGAFADVVLPDISHLPAWIDEQNASI